MMPISKEGPLSLTGLWVASDHERLLALDENLVAVVLADVFGRVRVNDRKRYHGTRFGSVRLSNRLSVGVIPLALTVRKEIDHEGRRMRV